MNFTPKSDLKIFQIFLGILELYFQFILYSLYIGGQFNHIRNIYPIIGIYTYENHPYRISTKDSYQRKTN